MLLYISLKLIFWLRLKQLYGCFTKESLRKVELLMLIQPVIHERVTVYVL